MKVILALGLFFSFSFYVQSAILLLNFNKNDSTVKAVRTAAAYRNEALIVFPFSNKHIESLPAENIGNINKDSITEILNIADAFASNNQTQITNIVFSGHAGAGGFSGKNGSLRKADFISALAAFPKIKTSVTSLLLRGCYTTTLAEVMPNESWRKALPNLTLIAGYQGKAWSSEKSASKSFVKEVLQIEELLITTNTVEELVKQYQTLTHYKVSEIAIWLKNQNDSGAQENFITTKRLIQGRVPINLTKMAKECQLNEPRATLYTNDIRKFYVGKESGYFRPLKNTHTSKNKLRKAYEFFNKNHHCQKYDYWLSLTNERLITPKNIMPLLFFNKIVENFDRAYDLKQLSELIAWANLMILSISNDFPNVEFLNFPDVGGRNINDKQLIIGKNTPDTIQSSRSAIIAFEIELNSFIINANNIPDMKSSINQKNLNKLKNYYTAYKQLLIDFSPLHLPHSWMTEDVYENRIHTLLSESKKSPINLMNNTP